MEMWCWWRKIIEMRWWWWKGKIIKMYWRSWRENNRNVVIVTERGNN